MIQTKRNILHIVCLALFVFISNVSYADVEIKMDTTTIKGNTELPKILYIVPWKQIKQSQHEDQQLLLHSLYGDLFNPVIPDLTAKTLTN